MTAHRQRSGEVHHHRQALSLAMHRSAFGVLLMCGSMPSRHFSQVARGNKSAPWRMPHIWWSAALHGLRRHQVVCQHCIANCTVRPSFLRCASQTLLCADTSKSSVIRKKESTNARQHTLSLYRRLAKINITMPMLNYRSLLSRDRMRHASTTLLSKMEALQTFCRH